MSVTNEVIIQIALYLKHKIICQSIIPSSNFYKALLGLQRTLYVICIWTFWVTLKFRVCFVMFWQDAPRERNSASGSSKSDVNLMMDVLPIAGGSYGVNIIRKGLCRLYKGPF